MESRRGQTASSYRHRPHEPKITIHRVSYTRIDDQVRGRLEHALGISLSAQQFVLENAIYEQAKAGLR